MQQTQRNGIVQGILRRLGNSPAVAVLGARQVGRTEKITALPLQDLAALELKSPA